jgi:hypothetical protein
MLKLTEAPLLVVLCTALGYILATVAVTTFGTAIALILLAVLVFVMSIINFVATRTLP